MGMTEIVSTDVTLETPPPEGLSSTRDRMIWGQEAHDLIMSAVPYFRDDPKVEMSVAARLEYSQVQESLPRSDDAFGMYLHHMGKYRVFNPETEQMPLFGMIDDGVIVLQEKPMLIEWSEADYQCIRTMVAAYQEIYVANLRYVVFQANLRMREKPGLRKLVTLEQLVAAGNEGLAHAITRFDRSRGTKFSGFAKNLIRECMGELLEWEPRAMRLPAREFGQYERLRKRIDDLAATLGHTLTTQEVVDHLGITHFGLIEHLHQSPFLPSLDVPRDEDGVSFGSLLPDSHDHIDALIERLDGDEPPALPLLRHLFAAADQSVLSDRTKLMIALFYDIDPNHLSLLGIEAGAEDLASYTAGYGLLRWGDASGQALRVVIVGRAFGLPQRRVKNIVDSALKTLQVAAGL